MLIQLMKFNLKYKLKNIIEVIYLYIFYMVSIALVSMLSQHNTMPGIAPIIWVLMLFALTASMYQFWAEDEQDGTIDQWRTSGVALEWVALAKWFVHVALIVIPLALIAGWGTQLVGFAITNTERVALVAAVGGAQMAAIGMLAAAICTGLRNTAGIIGIVMLPLTVPSMIWGSAALDSSANTDAIIILAAYAAITIPISCIASAASLRASG